MPRLRTAPGGVRRWNTSTPRSRGGGSQLLPFGSCLGTASWRALAPNLRACETLVRFEHRVRAARLAGRTANTVTACRSVSTRPVAATSPSAIERPRLSPRLRLGLPISFETEGRSTARCRLEEARHRSVASVFVITREHHLASRSTLAGSTPPSARCDASPFLRAAEGVLRPFRRPATLRWFVASFRCARVCEQRPGCVPNTSWLPLRGLRYGDTANSCASFAPGPSQRLRALPLLSRRGREAASPHDEVVSSCEDPPSRAAPRRIDTTRRVRGAVSSPPLWRAGPPRSLACRLRRGSERRLWYPAGPGSETTRLAQGPGARFASAIAWRIAALGAA